MENGFLLVELGRRGININDRTSLTGLRCASSAAAAIVSPGTRDAVPVRRQAVGSGLRCFLFMVSASALGVQYSVAYFASSGPWTVGTWP